MSRFLLGLIAGCFVPGIYRSINEKMAVNSDKETTYYRQYAEALCEKLNDSYDFSGTDEAEKNNKKIWRKYVSLPEELLMPSEYRMVVDPIRCIHMRNLKMLKDNPGIFSKDRVYHQIFEGLYFFNLFNAECGEFCIDGFWVNKDTTKEEMRTFFNDDKGFEEGNYVICQNIKTIDRQTFTCCMWFKDNGKIRSIKLTYFPLMIDEEVKKNRENVQEINRKSSEKWLSKRIGSPTKRTESETVYAYGWGEIGVSIDKSPNSNYDGGSIIITYK